MENKEPRYLLMDARGFKDAGNATILCCSDSENQAIKDSKMFGNYKKFEVCIFDTETDDVCWHLYDIK